MIKTLPHWLPFQIILTIKVCAAHRFLNELSNYDLFSRQTAYQIITQIFYQFRIKHGSFS